MSAAANPEVSWAQGVTFLSGSHGYVRTAVDGFELPNSFTRRVIVRATITTEDRRGYPNNNEAQLLSNIEDDLLSGLAEGVLVSVVTTNGERHYHVYTAPTTDLNSWAEGLRAAHAHHELQFALHEDPEQSTYKMLKTEALAADADRRTIDSFRANGADLDQKHEIDYFLYFPSEGQAVSASTQLNADVGTIEVSEDSDEGEWLLKYTLVGWVNYESIARDTTALRRIAADNGGEFDGWGAAISPST